MASATGIPERDPASREASGTRDGESEPLLGRPGDATQASDVSILRNLFLGTGSIAQLAVILLFVSIWVSVFTKPLILFSGHPLAQSFAILLLIQSILSLQPTHTPEQKRAGQLVHASLNLAALVALIAGVVIIEYNKFASNGPHFHSAHAYLGVITSVILLVQYFVGFTMWATPRLYGGDAKARSLWKYHRYSGYFVLLLLLATVCSATKTDYNVNVLHLKLWAVLLLSILIVVGVFPRIQKNKLGFRVSS